MNQIFTFAGVSRKHNELRFRTSNRAEYVDILIKEGHADVDIVSLPSPMSKDAAVLHLLTSDFAIDNDEAVQALTLEAQKRRLPGYAKVRAAKAEVAAEPEAPAEPVVSEDDNVIILAEEVKPKKARKSKAAAAMTAWAEAAEAEEQAA